jgi:prepilin-type processing-associated H-X9-DG protein
MKNASYSKKYYSYAINVEVSKVDNINTKSRKRHTVKNISSIILITDATDLEDVSAYKYSANPERLGTIHSNRANLLFGDGHIENKSRNELQQSDFIPLP